MTDPDPETMASGESCDVLGCGPGHRCGWPKHQVEDALQAFRAANGWNIPDEGSGVANDFFRGGFHSQDAVIVRLRDELADLQSAALHYADLRPREEVGHRMDLLRAALERALPVLEGKVNHDNCPDGQNCPERDLAIEQIRSTLALVYAPRYKREPTP